jgi:hypothetical protein
MTQTPPCGPDEPTDLFSLAARKVQELQQLTQEIQAQSQNPTLPVLTQLIFQREERLSELNGMGLQALPPERQAVLLGMLQACQGMDPQIEQHLKQLRQSLETQLQSLKGGQSLISKYKIVNPQEASTHSQDA